MRSMDELARAEFAHDASRSPCQHGQQNPLAISSAPDKDGEGRAPSIRAAGASRRQDHPQGTGYRREVGVVAGSVRRGDELS